MDSLPNAIIPMSWGIKYEQDHLHPESRFNGSKPISVSMEDWKKWRGMRNRLSNLHLLEGRSNGSKNDMRLVDYYNDMNDEQKAEFCKQAMIPKDVSLEIEDFVSMAILRSPFGGADENLDLD
jgi:hypothetical protein